MYSTRSPESSIALFSGFRLMVVLAGMAWTVFQFAGFFSGGAVKISASGEYSPLAFPEPQRLELSSPLGERMQMQSVWRFNVKNEGAQEVQDLVFELPFRGFYQVSKPGQTGAPKAAVADFNRQIQIGSLSPAKEIAVTVWSDVPATEDLERETRLNLQGGNVAIEYPVKVHGVMAWLERSKGAAALLALIVLLLVFL